ncbi:S1C family serine protease [Elioraea thermophila]|uniref:S1C family serine protease n=1 Tax=Elioraea thermophila TaxID=2185104 RepID=UPI000DF2B9B8|nr:trypsin-like peptidase domain-containing protein [Elioraea thermophila]
MSGPAFLLRLSLITLAAILVAFAWQWAPMLQSMILAQRAEPRVVTPRGELAEIEQATVALFEAARGSVVHITTTERVIDPWTRSALQVPRGTGSGFFWDEFGHVVTNHHVIANASAAFVRLADGRSYRAALVGASPAHDLAVLRIGVALARPQPLPIGTSADLRVGQSVFAIGNPFGLDWTLTTGIVSALNRDLRTDGQVLEGLIQTDAAINPGNSGGPLLDSAGRVIGVNTAIVSPSGAFSGIGFAVPIDVVNRVVPRLIATGRYVRAGLGVRVDEALNAALAQRTGTTGVFVLGVEPGSAAARAGIRPAQVDRDGTIRPGDVLLAIDGQAVGRPAELIALLERLTPGARVTVAILREGRRIEVAVELDAVR